KLEFRRGKFHRALGAALSRPAPKRAPGMYKHFSVCLCCTRRKILEELPAWLREGLGSRPLVARRYCLPVAGTSVIARAAYREARGTEYTSLASMRPSCEAGCRRT